MKKYEILWKKSAVKEINTIPKDTAIKILELIDKLADEPRPSNCIKLTGLSNYYRIRIGNHRIIYSIQDSILIIEIIKIGHRKDVYRDN